jgi:hypothetical protein
MGRLSSRNLSLPCRISASSSRVAAHLHTPATNALVRPGAGQCGMCAQSRRASDCGAGEGAPARRPGKDAALRGEAEGLTGRHGRLYTSGISGRTELIMGVKKIRWSELSVRERGGLAALVTAQLTLISLA